MQTSLEQQLIHLSGVEANTDTLQAIKDANGVLDNLRMDDVDTEEILEKAKEHDYMNKVWEDVAPDYNEDELLKELESMNLDEEPQLPDIQIPKHPIKDQDQHELYEEEEEKQMAYA